jgi:ferredoxin
MSIPTKGISMPRITADPGTCQGYGNCLTNASDVFDIDDDGVVVVLRDTVDEADRPRVEEAVRSCPVDALRVTD